MLESIQKYSPLIYILLLIILLITLLFFPNIVNSVSMVVIIFGLGIAILFTIYANWEIKKGSKLTNVQFARNTTIDLLGLAFTMLTAMWLGRMAGSYAGQVLGVLAGIIIGIAISFAAALFVGRVWGVTSSRFKARAVL